MFPRSLVGLAACAFVLSAVPSFAGPVYTWNGGSNGSTSNYSYAVADNFTVNWADWAVNSLSLYDSTKGTIGNDIFVVLYNDTTNTLVASLDFKNVTDPTASQFVSKSLATAINLVKGDTYSIEAYGFTASNKLYVDTAGTSSISFDGMGGALSDLSSSNCNLGAHAFNGLSDASCSPLNAHPKDFFGGGSLSVIDVPEPATWSVLIAGLLMFGFTTLRNRGRKNG